MVSSSRYVCNYLPRPNQQDDLARGITKAIHTWSYTFQQMLPRAKVMSPLFGVGSSEDELRIVGIGLQYQVRRRCW